jgi:glycosyltransferase involved in cell wall biosynthesis
MTQPLVSIYIPTRNRPELLRRAVCSCLAQSYKALEIIIVDDGSDEQFRDPIDQIARLDPRVSILHNPQSQGACAARNLAIKAAKGEFITGLDDDDEFTPDRISCFAQSWPKFQSLSFLSAGYKVIQRNGQYCYGQQARQISFDDLLYANYVGNQLFTKTEYLRSIDGFDQDMPSCQDYDVWLRLSQRYGAGYRLKLITYIVHQEHESPRISQSPNRNLGYIRLIEKHRASMSDAQYRNQLFYQALYTEQWSAMRLLGLAGRKNIVVAMKNIVLRYYFQLKTSLFASASAKN